MGSRRYVQKQDLVGMSMEHIFSPVEWLEFNTEQVPRFSRKYT